MAQEALVGLLWPPLGISTPLLALLEHEGGNGLVLSGWVVISDANIFSPRREPCVVKLLVFPGPLLKVLLMLLLSVGS